MIHSEEAMDTGSSLSRRENRRTSRFPAPAPSLAVCHEIFERRSILGNILAWLPPVGLGKARCVCTLWNRMATSRKSNKNPCWILCSNNWSWKFDKHGRLNGRAFDPSTYSWMTIPLLHWNFVILDRFPQAASIGLIAFHATEVYHGESGPTQFILVGNPLTNVWKRIPYAVDRAIPHDPNAVDDHYELIVDEESNSYSIVQFSIRRDPRFLTTAIYNPRTNQWTEGTMYHVEGFIVLRTCTLSDNSIYFLQILRGGGYEHSMLRIVGYDVRGDYFFEVITSNCFHKYTIDFEPLQLIFQPSAAGGEREVPSILSSITRNGKSAEQFGFLTFDSASGCWTWDEDWNAALDGLLKWFLDVFQDTGPFTVTGDPERLYMSSMSTNAYNVVVCFKSDTREWLLLPSPWESLRFDTREVKLFWSDTKLFRFFPRLDIRP